VYAYTERRSDRRKKNVVALIKVQRKAVNYMSAYNERRTGNDRREGDRRWLGYLIAFANSLKQGEDTGKSDTRRAGDRRTHRSDRRNVNDTLNHINF
jgi:hypothetical protein